MLPLTNVIKVMKWALLSSGKRRGMKVLGNEIKAQIRNAEIINVIIFKSKIESMYLK